MTDRSTAGNAALIHDQSNTIIESSDSDEDLSGSPDKGAKRDKTDSSKNQSQQQLQ